MYQCQAADPQFEVGVTEEDDEVGNMLQISMSMLQVPHLHQLCQPSRDMLLSVAARTLCVRLPDRS